MEMCDDDIEGLTTGCILNRRRNSLPFQHSIQFGSVLEYPNPTLLRVHH